LQLTFAVQTDILPIRNLPIRKEHLMARFDQSMTLEEFRYGDEFHSLHFPALTQTGAIRPEIAGWLVVMAAVLGTLWFGMSIEASRHAYTAETANLSD
jgi:hypothetical protein